MDANSESEVTVINNSFYPEKIIFCVDISGEMNELLKFKELPYSSYKEADSSDNYQVQNLSVPTSTNPTPEDSPKISHKYNTENYKVIEPMNATTSNVNTASPNNRPTTISQQNNGFISDTNSTTSNKIANMTPYSNNNNNNYSPAPITKSRSIKSIAKKILPKNKDDDSGTSDSGSRSITPIKNLLKGSNNNDNFVNGNSDNNVYRHKKSSYSNVFNNNHNRASSNSSTSSLNSLSNSSILNNKDNPPNKTTIELTRLEAVKRYIKRFVALKGSLCRDHQYALVLLGVDAVWFNDFTSDYKNIINAVEGIPAQQEIIKEFDMDSLLNLINERSLIPNILTASHFLRVIFLYARPTIPHINLDNAIFQQLHENKLFMFDCVYFHEKKNENNNPQAVFYELLNMEDQNRPSFFFDVIENGQKFSIAMMKLLGHPLQRRLTDKK